MENDHTKLRRYYETLIQNAQKGESYLLKLKNNPTVYFGIPLIRYNLASKDDNSFVMNVLEPLRHKGIHKISIQDIEMLVKKDIST